jgi:hypothetical protein
MIIEGITNRIVLTGLVLVFAAIMGGVLVTRRTSDRLTGTAT